jgi:DNA-nicking Smr family endonuclease
MTDIPEDDALLFEQQMRGVKPLKKSKKINASKTPKPLNPPLKSSKNQDADINQYTPNPILSSIVEKTIKKPVTIKNKVTFPQEFENEITITSESKISYGLEALSSSHQTRVQKGELKIDAKIDLHGLDRFEAQERLQRFISHARVHHNRYLLVIHGKGGKHGGTPILKQHIFYYLKLSPHILSLQSAHPKHGGTGALYVILKKNKV